MTDSQALMEERAKVLRTPVFAKDGYSIGNDPILSIGHKALLMGSQDGRLCEEIASRWNMHEMLVSRNSRLLDLLQLLLRDHSTLKQFRSAQAVVRERLEE